MPYILFYDSPNSQASFQTTLMTSNNCSLIDVFPKSQVNSTITWKGTYKTNQNGCCVLTVDNKTVPYLFYEMELFQPKISGDKVLLNSTTFLEDFEKLLDRLGLNFNEETDMMTTWTIEMLSSPYTIITIFDETLTMEVKVEVKGFEEYHRVIIGIESITANQAEEIQNKGIIKQIEEIPIRQRPNKKYILEWGGIELNEFH
ncbi:Uncharacterized protein QTN25_000879 [Entamoeba marina]